MRVEALILGLCILFASLVYGQTPGTDANGQPSGGEGFPTGGASQSFAEDTRGGGFTINPDGSIVLTGRWKLVRQE